MKSQLAMYSMFAALAATGGFGETGETYVPASETEEQRKKRLSVAEIEIRKNQGLKEFQYGENTVLALNKKNADKKAKKLGYI